MFFKENARAIIIENDHIYLMYRKKLINGKLEEYYVTPGGKKEKDEKREDTVIRELKEEFCVDIKIIKYLGYNLYHSKKAYFYLCEIIKGIPKLGGEEKEECNDNNYYEVRKIPLKDLNKYNVVAINKIKKAIKVAKDLEL